MRAVSFALAYEPGADPVADAFREHPNLYARSLACVVTPDHYWRVDRLTGPTEALADAVAAVADHGHAADCFGDEDCGTDARTEVLYRDPSTRILYRCWTRTEGCSSIPHLALEYVGPGVLFATERHRDTYVWHVLLPTDSNLGAFSEAVQSAQGAGVRFDLRQVTDESAWLAAHSGRPALPYTQFEAMREAVERGYYETPREITVEELAEELDTPRSTLSYRLRRAEAELARSFVGRES